MISVAPNGGRLVKSDHPNIPLGPKELARAAAEVADCGAAMIHVHVRDKLGNHLLDASAFEDVINAIKLECKERILVQITTEALGVYTPQEQESVLRKVQPKAASMALREFVPDPSHEKSFGSLMSWVKQHEILPQIILYSPQDATYLKDLIARGIIPYNDIPVLYVLGRYVAGQTSRPEDILPFLGGQQPKFKHWAVCAFGKHEASCVVTAGLLGGHVRVGFENNYFLPNGNIADTNAELVAAVVDPLQKLGCEPMPAAQLVDEWQALLKS